MNPSGDKVTLMCWHSERAGFEVLRQALKSLANRGIEPGRVLYLVRAGHEPEIPDDVGVPVEALPLRFRDPTGHDELYRAVRDTVLPRLGGLGPLHVNISPGTPAMHAVWIVLHAGGALPPDTRLWSSQFNPATKRRRIDRVEFPITTYLGEVHALGYRDPDLAVYEPESRSPARAAALERLARYAKVPGAPLLLLGERGTGKTRTVETLVATLKGRPHVVTLACGGLDSALADSLLFGHEKGAFTGATASRTGLLEDADGGILFLDEVQDLPRVAQRKLVRVFQDHRRRFRPLGSDQEKAVDVDLVCASNLGGRALRERLDPDLHDRLSHLTVTIPPLRDCRDDIKADWLRVWRELRRADGLPDVAPWNEELRRALVADNLPGNLRDLQHLAVLVIAWWSNSRESVPQAIGEWTARRISTDAAEGYGTGSRRDRIRWFKGEMARWAKGHYRTWKDAATALKCDQKTLREDARYRPRSEGKGPSPDCS